MRKGITTAQFIVGALIALALLLVIGYIYMTISGKAPGMAETIFLM